VTGKAAFLGLGAMGYPMAGHLARIAETSVWNRTPAKAEAWAKEHAGRPAADVGEAVRGADAVFACLGADKDVEEVFRACLPQLQSGAIFVDHTTASADLARRLAGEAAQRGVGFLDAPVSGGEAGARKGALTIMIGGEAAVLERAQPYFAAYGKSVTLIGPAGAGQLAKMVNQICIAGVVQGLAEGLHFAERAGLDPETVVAAIGQGAAQSWQMDNRWRTMTKGKFDFGFAVDWMRKDLGLVLDEARRNGAQLPLAALVDQFYAEVQAMGGKRWDTSSLIARLKN
jgi:3-hydroxyisobutyrate dehydrogenase-like beta-hydroxyacid dehydrogenase